jgi:hypothetical protein
MQYSHVLQGVAGMTVGEQGSEKQGKHSTRGMICVDCFCTACTACCNIRLRQAVYCTCQASDLTCITGCCSKQCTGAWQVASCGALEAPATCELHNCSRRPVTLSRLDMLFVTTQPQLTHTTSQQHNAETNTKPRCGIRPNCSSSPFLTAKIPQAFQFDVYATHC